MIRIKGNYKNAFNDLNCRACKSGLETHQHILEECVAIHLGANIDMNPFSTNIHKLKVVASHVETVSQQLEENESLKSKK